MMFGCKIPLFISCFITIFFTGRVNSSLQSQITGLQQEVDRLLTRVQFLEETLPAKRTVNYAFTAWKNSYETYSEGDTILFENVLLNLGDAYDPDTSRFTCNVTGPHFVSLNLRRYTTYDLVVDAVYEGVRLFSIDDYDTDHPYSYASNSCVFNCVAGNDIWVRAFDSGRVDGGDQRSTFTVIAL